MSNSVLEMSDEEIMNMNNPPELDETEDTEQKQQLEETEDSGQLTEDNVNEVEEQESELEDNSQNTSIYNNNSDTIQSINNNNNTETPDYESFYKKVMAPFKANGKEYNLKNADEVISLMQKGVDYTRKTQDIARYKKSIAMLERANLLDQNQISFFIDLMNGDQEAIRKLLKDKNIDTFDLPSDDEPINYVEGAHNITDEQMVFQDTVRDISSQQGGGEFLQQVMGFDATSKQKVFAEPQLLKALFSNKQAGVYDTIVEEMERQRILGHIPDDVPFIAAYKVIGDMLYKGGNKSSGRNGSYNQPLTRRPAITSNRLNNSQRARSAGITRSSTKTVRTSTDYLKMSDEEFLKQFGE